MPLAGIWPPRAAQTGTTTLASTVRIPILNASWYYLVANKKEPSSAELVLTNTCRQNVIPSSDLLQGAVRDSCRLANESAKLLEIFAREKSNLFVLLDQFFDHIPNLMPDVMLIIQHA